MLCMGWCLVQTEGGRMAGIRDVRCHPNCPPSDTPDVDGEYFHLSCSDPVSHLGGTLKTASEMNTNRKKDPCQRCGLSMFLSSADCLLLISFLPLHITAKWTHIASAQLKPAHGWLKPTDGAPNHHTWWPSADLSDRCILFDKVQKI